MTVRVDQPDAAPKRRLRLPAWSSVNIQVWRIAVFIAFIGLWWLLAVVEGQNFLPTPAQTVTAAISVIRDGSLPRATLSSLVVFLSGFVLAACFAIPFGLFMGGVRVFGATFEGYVNAFSAMPRVAFIPLVIVFLGLGYEAKVMIVFIGAVMPMITNTYYGVLNSDGELIEMARSAGATKLQIFTKLMLPGALPYITAGLRIGASLALINTIVAELYTAVDGLGGLLSIYGNSFRMGPYFAVICTLAVLAVLVMQCLKLLDRSMDRRRFRSDPV